MITKPLREEHNELRPHVEELKSAADAVGAAPVEEVRKRIEGVEEFLRHSLVPHATAEERALYPMVQKIMGADEATATMSRDHEEIQALSHELSAAGDTIDGGAVDEHQAKELRRILYGLYALIRLHFEKEEDVYLPLLDSRLSEHEGTELFAAMEAAAAEASRE